MVAYRGILTGLTKSTDHPSGPFKRGFRALQGSYKGKVDIDMDIDSDRAVSINWR